MSKGLKEKRVIVTAGASGIGRTVAEAFAGAGAIVFVCDIDTDAVDILNADASGIVAINADVSDENQVKHFFRNAVDSMGGLDILVSNAGTPGPIGPVESVSADEWRQTIAVNLNGQFFCAQEAVPVMKRQQSGCIVNVSSSGGLHGCPLRAPYAAAKWGIIGLAKTLAMELGPHGIRVNAICPGSVEGERIDRVIAAEAESRGISETEVRDSYLRQTSMRTFVSAQDVADLILFVCSDAGAKISGQALSVDGHTETLRTI